MINNKKVIWCENWLRKTFSKYPSIERNLLFKMASDAGLYIKGTYGSELSVALTNLGVKDKSVNHSETGEFLYCALYI